MAISKIKLPDNSVQDIHDSRVPVAAWFNQTNTTMYWFASAADKASFIADQTQTSLVLFSTFVDLVLKRIILTDSAGETTKSTTEDQTTLSITVDFVEQEKPIAGGTWEDNDEGAIDVTVYVDTGNTGTYTQLGTTQHFTGPDDYTVNVRSSLVLGTNKVKIECVASADSTVTSSIEYTVSLLAEPYIQFADSSVGQICATEWGDGVGITASQAADVPYTTSAQQNAFWNAFTNAGTMTSFDELDYFTNVNTIPNSKFKNNTNLTSIGLTNITILNSCCFENCSALAIEVDMPNAQFYVNYYGQFKASGITKIKNLGSTQSLASYDFGRNCTSLTEVHLPSTLTAIGRLQFWGCTNLTTVVCLATTPPTASGRNFDTSASTKIYVPYSSDHSILDAYKAASGWSDNASQIYELNSDGTVPTS